ncbi:MAG TPA: hypothetical protein VLC52_04055, partial [Anaerolineae bacterium]|nr:hypothetical protein [Anaerolineae bacterium]
GQPSVEATYVYVAQSQDPFLQQLPAVMLGLDVAVVKGGQVAVLSLVAPEESFATARRSFRKFVDSAEVTPSTGSSQ